MISIRFRQCARTWGAALLICTATASGAGAATYYVDGANPSATDSGPGSESTPYRTISAAVSQRGGPGTTILVKPASYREQVTVGASGSSSSRFVIRALGGGVVVDGADDFSSTGLWTRYSGDVWLARSVSWEPLQVFADGSRLDPSTRSPGSLPSRSFRYVSGTGLYANVGGGNPGSHDARVGRRSYGFRLSGRSWVTIDGFTVTRTEDKGLYLSSGSSHVEISGNTVSFANKQGIAASGASSDLLIAGNRVFENNDHGIYLVSGVTGSMVRDNESFANARPNVRAANGLYLNGASGNRIERNRAHDNQDSGIQINASSNNNVCVQNISWSNGDHGFDHLGSSGTLHVGDVAWGNYKDGFSIEGSAPGTQLYDCIAVDNGITTNEYDLWVDSSSSSGFVSDYNLFWNSTSQPPVKFISTTYSSVSAYAAATGRDAHSIQANPRFAGPASGNFHLLAGSPAIDAANSSVSQWPSLDAEGRARYDDPATPNTGAGPVRYADLGALEFTGSGGNDNQPPVARLTVTPASGTAPLAVTADASASDDPDGWITSYRFDFGDGTVIGPQGSATAGHTYGAGDWTVTVYVTDNGGWESSTSRSVSVAPGVDHPPVVSAPASATVAETSQLTVQVTASDPDGQAIGSLTADLSGLPAGANASFSAGSGNTSGTLTWTPTYDDAGVYQVSFRAANTLAGTAQTEVTVTNVDRAPSVSAPTSVRGDADAPLTVEVTASDPDGEPITSLTADLSSLPDGSGASFEANATNTAGTLHWTPRPVDKGTYKIDFVASNALSGSATTNVHVHFRGRVHLAAIGGSGPIESLPTEFALRGASPNPSSGAVSFELDMPYDAPVEWSVFDLQGRRVWGGSAVLEAGRRRLTWSGATLAGPRAGAGLYLVRIETEGRRLTRRFVRL